MRHDRNIQKSSKLRESRKFYDEMRLCWTWAWVDSIQAWSINFHLAQSQELFFVCEDDVHVATVHSVTLETNRIPFWDVWDEGTSDGQE